MNGKQLTRELRRLARQEVPDQPDLWPGTRARLNTQSADAQVGSGRGTAKRADAASVYTWYSDARRSRFGAGALAVAAGLILVVLVAGLALMFGNRNSDQPAVGAGATTTSSRAATPIAWSETGVSVVLIVPLNGSDVGGEVYAQVHPNGDVRLTGTPTGSEEVLFWHVVPGSCERWSGATNRGTPTDELLPTFYSQSHRHAGADR